MTLCAALGGVVTCCPLCPAQLVWAETTTSITCKAEEPSVLATLSCTNDGVEPIAIRRVQSSCGCIDVARPDLIYPGDEGVIDVTVALSGRPGRSTHAVTLWTDGDETPVELKITVDAQEPVRAEPRRVIWTDRQPLTVSLAIREDCDVELNEVRLEGMDGFAARLERRPGRYDLILTPPPDAPPSRGRIVVLLDRRDQDRNERIRVQMPVRIAPVENASDGDRKPLSRARRRW